MHILKILIISLVSIFLNPVYGQQADLKYYKKKNFISQSFEDFVHESQRLFVRKTTKFKRVVERDHKYLLPFMFAFAIRLSFSLYEKYKVNQIKCQKLQEIKQEIQQQESSQQSSAQTTQNEPNGLSKVVMNKQKIEAYKFLQTSFVCRMKKESAELDRIMDKSVNLHL